MEIKKFENSLIAFDFESEIINANDMSKPFKKRPVDFLKLESTKAFIDTLECEVNKNNITDFKAVTTIKGNYSDGRSQGTWMCRLLALKFAAWLDPRIEIFVYSVFDKYMKEKLENQQRQLDYFWDKSDQKDLYR